MEVKWLIIARDFEVKDNASLSIYEILDTISFNHEPPYETKLKLIARMNIEPIETDGTVIIKVQINEKGEGVFASEEYKYPVVTLLQWATKIPVFTVDFGIISFVNTGEYCFEIYLNGELKGSEWLIIDAKYGGENGEI